jgi:hypothetical protein
MSGRLQRPTNSYYSGGRVSVVVKRICRLAALGVAMLVGVGLCARPAQATFIETITQVGSNVVVAGSGTLNLSGLTYDESFTGQYPFIFPNLPAIVTGAKGSVDAYGHVGEFTTAPTSLGSGSSTLASSGNGDVVGIEISELYVPEGYVSGDPLSGSSTYDDATFSSLGFTPGYYVWSWGDGDSLTLSVGTVSPTPEPTAFALFGPGILGLAGLIGVQRRQKRTAI